MSAVSTTQAPPVQTYSTIEAALMAGISYRQLDYFLRTGTVRPDWDPQPGSGRSRRWSAEEVDWLCEAVNNWRNAEAVVRDFRSGKLWQQIARGE